MKKDLHNFVYLVAAMMLLFGAASFYSAKIQKAQKAEVEKEMRFAQKTIQKYSTPSRAKNARTVRKICETPAECDSLARDNSIL